MDEANGPLIEFLEQRLLLSGAISGVPMWVEQGPAPIGTSSGGAIVGAIEVMALHPTNADIMYVGAVNGGIWKTTNATWSTADHQDNDLDGLTDEPDEKPSWTPLTDQWPSLSTGALAFDPTDSSHQTLWAGNGFFSNGFTDGPRLGLMRTTDGGATWSELARVRFQNQAVRSIIPTTIMEDTGQVVLVAAEFGGVYRSADAGANWARVSGAAATTDNIDNDGDGLTDEAGELNLPDAGASQLLADPADPMRFYAAIANQGVFASDDGGVTWRRSHTGITGVGGSVRIALAAESYSGGTNVLYAAVVDKVEVLSGVFRSSDAGHTWSAVGSAPSTGRQGYTNIAIVADPNDAAGVFVAGQTTVFRGDATTGTWQSMEWDNANATGPHDDARQLQFDIHGDHLIEVDDGGIYRLRDPGTPGRRWEPMIGNLAVTEVNALAYDWLHDIVFIGTQDNSSDEQTSSGGKVWRKILGGDGGIPAVEVDGDIAYRYMIGNNYHDFQRRKYGTKNGVANSLLESTPVMLAADATPDQRASGLNDEDQKFDSYALFQLRTNLITPSRVVMGTGSAIYESVNRLDTITDITPANLGQVRALAYGGRLGGSGVADVLYAGAVRFVTGQPPQPQLWLRTSGSGAPTRVNSYPGGIPRDIVLDPENWHTAFVLDESGRIWRTTDAGATAGNWRELTQDADGTRSLPINLRTIEFVRAGGGSAPVLLAGGDGGVYRRINPDIGANSTSWSEFGLGLPNAVVMDLLYDTHDHVLLAGTYGRGVWTLPNADQSIAFSSTLTITGDQDFDHQDDVIHVALNPRNPLLLDIYVNNNTDTPTMSVEHAAFASLAIDGVGGIDQISLAAMPAGTSVAIYGGDGKDLLQVMSSNTRSPITINGGDDEDWIVVTPSPHVQIFVDGGSPGLPVSPGDTLNVLRNGAPFTIQHGVDPDQGAVQVTGKLPVNFDYIESVVTDQSMIAPDRFEPHDDRLNAFNLVEGDQTHVGLSIHEPNNHDWYRWQANATGTLVIELFFRHRDGDIDLILRDAAGALLVTADSSTDNESIVYEVTNGQVYYIEVYGFFGATNPQYALELDWPFGVSHDGLEPNDSPAQARNLGGGDQSHEHLTVHDESGEFVSNADFYRWKAPTTGTLTVDLKFLHALGDIQLDFYDASQVLRASSRSATDNEQITYTVIAGQEYFIHVYGASGAVHPDYALVIDGPDIPVASFEPNDNLAAATDLLSGRRTVSGLTLHQPGDEDWFRWTATQADTATFEVLFSHAVGDVDIELFNEFGGFLARAASSTDNETLMRSVLPGEVYHLRVYGFNNATHDQYTLRITGPFNTPADAFEPNDQPTQPHVLGLGDHHLTGLTIHEAGGSAGNDDWFAWTAATMGLTRVDLRFRHALGDIDLQVFDSAQQPVASATSATDDETTTFDAAAGQTYLIRVYGYLDATNPRYDLHIDGPEIPIDEFEPNDAIEHAYALGMGDQQRANLTIHDTRNDDWFQWMAAADGILNIHVLFTHAQGDIDAELFDEDGQFLQRQQSSTDNERIAQAVQAGRRYYLRVYGYNGALNPAYALTFNGPDIPADAFEPNNTRAEATDLGTDDQVLSNLTIHRSQDDDLFRIIARATGLLDVRIQFSHDLGDLDLRMLDSDGVAVAGSLSLSDNEGIVFPVQAGQTYYIRVYGARARYTSRPLYGPPVDIVDAALQAQYTLTVTQPSLTGDFNGDSVVDAEDIRLLCAEIRAATNHRTYDLNGDEVVDLLDHQQLIRGVLNTELGDANLDGRVNITDLSILATYFSGPGHWPQGDFNCDGMVTITDLATLAAYFEFDRGIRQSPGSTLTGPDDAPVVDLLADSAPLRIVWHANTAPVSAPDASWRHIADLLAG